jgi:hypothetical protein
VIVPTLGGKIIIGVFGVMVIRAIPEITWVQGFHSERAE